MDGNQPVQVLVIDDDIGMTELLSMLLSSASSKILTANNGQDGIQLVQSQKPDIIILDLMMPGMNGWQVCKSVRAFSDTPILILTAIDDSGAIAQALDAGADDYLVKPVSSGTLVLHLNKLLRRNKIALEKTPAEAK